MWANGKKYPRRAKNKIMKNLEQNRVLRVSLCLSVCVCMSPTIVHTMDENYLKGEAKLKNQNHKNFSHRTKFRNENQSGFNAYITIIRQGARIVHESCSNSGKFGKLFSLKCVYNVYTPGICVVGVTIILGIFPVETVGWLLEHAMRFLRYIYLL